MKMKIAISIRHSKERLVRRENHPPLLILERLVRRESHPLKYL